MLHGIAMKTALFQWKMWSNYAIFIFSEYSHCFCLPVGEGFFPSDFNNSITTRKRGSRKAIKNGGKLISHIELSHFKPSIISTWML